jgi:hypothetical protein
MDASTCGFSRRKDLGGPGIGIFQIAERTSTTGAVMHTRRNNMRRIKTISGILDPVAGCREMVAQGALLHNTKIFIEPTYARTYCAGGIGIRTGSQTGLASCAYLFVNQYDIVVGVAIGCASRAGANARRVGALLTLDRQPIHIDVRMRPNRVDWLDMAKIIAQTDTVLELAGYDATVTTGATIEIDN